jgi:hypothetical protein
MWPVWVIQVIIAIVTAVVAYALTPKPKAPPGQKAQDVTSPTLDAGTPLQVVFGRIRVRNPNTLYYGGDRTTEIKK